MPKLFPFIYFRWRQICPVPSPCSRGPTILARCLYLPYLCSPHSPGLFDCLLYVALLNCRPAAWTSRSKRTSPMRPTISMRSSGRSGCAEDKDEKILGLCVPLTVFFFGGGGAVCVLGTRVVWGFARSSLLQRQTSLVRRLTSPSSSLWATNPSTWRPPSRRRSEISEDTQKWSVKWLLNKHFSCSDLLPRAADHC